MRRALAVIVVLVFCSIFVGWAVDEPLEIGGDFGREWLAKTEAVSEEPVTASIGNDLWSWGGIPIGHKVVNGTLEPERNLTIINVDDWLMMASLQEPIVIDLSSAGNIRDWMSTVYSDDPWVLAQHYERPIAFI
jgi:hypothetical protein